MRARLRLLHAIHDFLPRHRAGSEIYAHELAKELSARHDVFVLAAEYDPSAPHGTIRWRHFDGLPVIEIVNNWRFDRFEETYDSPRINGQLAHALAAARPDVVHVHNLLNLSFSLPRLAHERGIATVATLHDYTAFCASGGQRVHVAESHVCTEIEPARCARCFTASPFHAQMAASVVTAGAPGQVLGRVASGVRRRFPMLAERAARQLPASSVTAEDLARRLSRAHDVFDDVDLVVSPSPAMATEYAALGVSPQKMQVSDYGFRVQAPLPRQDPAHVRIGFVGTLVWHKGAHVLLEAARRLKGAFEVSIAGDSGVGPAYFRRLRTLAEGLPVRFTGGFDRELMPQVYRDLDVLVVPSLWPENSPLVIHEAFMHGAAVVGAHQGGVPDLVKNGDWGFTYDPFSPAALAEVLQRFVDDPRLAARLAARAPAVKTIAEDAREWEARYDAVRRVGGFA